MADGVEGFLSGVRVIDCTEFLAGPYCTWILASLGAEVIKIERPGGDQTRRRRLGGARDSVPFHMVHSNKKSVVADLKTAAGQELVKRLTSTSDVFVENFRRGVMERFGLGHEELRRAHPSLVYGSVRGFSEQSAYRDLGGVDMVAQAMGGLVSVTGAPGDAGPSKAGFPIGDMGAGMWAAIGIMAALHRRTATHEGAFVCANLMDSIIAWAIWDLGYVMMTGENPGRRGSAHLYLSPFECYPCADGRYIAVGAGNNRHWSHLCALMQRPDLVDDPRFEELYERGRRADEVRAELTPIFRTKPADEWVKLLRDVGIPCGPVQEISDVIASQYVVDAGMLSTVRAEHEDVRVVNLPLAVDGPGLVERQPGPELGSSTRWAMEMTGYSDEEIARYLGSIER